MTLQLTFGFELTSFVTVAFKENVALTLKEAGASAIVTAMETDGTIWIVALVEIVGYATEVATSATVPPEGGEGGAVNWMAPISLVGVNDPQLPADPQVSE